MYIEQLVLKNFRRFDNRENIIFFNKGLNVLVGENDSGKSAIMDALRIVLGVTDLSWYRIETSDFYNEDRNNDIVIKIIFRDLTEDECAAFLENLTYEEETPILCLYWRCRSMNNFTPARTDISVTSGLDGNGPAIAGEARELLRVTYLRAMRDAYSNMQSGRNSRLSQILHSVDILKKGKDVYESGDKIEELSIAGIASLTNYLLENNEGIKQENRIIGEIIRDMLVLKGENFSTQLQVTNSGGQPDKNLTALLEKLDLTLKSDNLYGRVGLGTSNIMSIACEMLLTHDQDEKSSFLLIEEPEAHIHAQRQLKIMQSLQNSVKDSRQQIILTTHSPLLASVIDLNNISVIKDGKGYSLAKNHTLLDESDYKYLSMYLDATKANLFFAKGVLIVEGPAEELLLPTIAKLIGRDFIDYGVSIVNVRGIGLRRYAKIFQQKSGDTLSIPVACVTDRDILPDCAPKMCINDAYVDVDSFPEKSKRRWRAESEFTSEEKERHVNDIKSKADGQRVKTFVSSNWTLEHDLFLNGIKDEMLDALAETLGNKKEDLEKEIYAYQSEAEQAVAFYKYFFDGRVSKAIYAQCLANKLEEKYSDENSLTEKLPEYIVNAILYVTGEEVA